MVYGRVLMLLLLSPAVSAWAIHNDEWFEKKADPQPVQVEPVKPMESPAPAVPKRVSPPPTTVEPVSAPASIPADKPPPVQAAKVSAAPALRPLEYELGLEVYLDGLDAEQKKTGQSAVFRHGNFDARRARLEVKVVAPEYTGKISVETAGGFELKNAYVDWNLARHAKLMLGQFKRPFGSEGVISSEKSLMIEPSPIGDYLTGARDLGVMVHNLSKDKNMFYYGIGIMNGAAENSDDDNNKLEFVGRVSLQPVRGGGSNLWFGASMQVGAQTAGDDEEFKIRTESRSKLTLFEYDVPAGVEYKRNNKSVEFFYQKNRLLFIGEYLVNENKFDKKVTITGGHLSAGFFLTPNRHKFKNGMLGGLKGGVSGWGAFQLAARYSSAVIDEQFFNPEARLYAGHSAAGLDQGQKITTSALGLNWFAKKNLRLSLNYITTKASAAYLPGQTPNRISENAILLRLFANL